MEIVTAYSKTDLEQLISETVNKCLKQVLKPPTPEVPDIINIDEAVLVTGYSKPTIYKKSFLNEIPCARRGKRLIFSRRDLLAWMEAQTVPKLTASDIASEHLARVAMSKRS